MTREKNPGSVVSDELLQRYHDGELSEAERVQVEAKLDDGARARLSSLEELGSLLREHAAYDADTATASSSLSATILAIERGAKPASREPAPEAASPSPAPRRRVLPFTLLGSALAGAAALAFSLLVGPLPSSDASANETEVETLEVQGSVATVFRVQSSEDDKQSATVIWASLDADDDDGDEAPAPADETEESEAL